VIFNTVSRLQWLILCAFWLRLRLCIFPASKAGGEAGMGAALPIADHHDALELRSLARQEKNVVCRHGWWRSPMRLMAWRPCPQRPEQRHPRPDAALQPETQPGRKALPPRTLPKPPRLRGSRRHHRRSCHAWNALADHADRIKSLACQTWIKKGISK